MFPLNVYSASMPQPNDAERALSSDQMQARIRSLESDLEVARAAATNAEAEQGRLQGELTKTTELWVAACHAREQWDVLFSENVEDLRLANERLEEARRSRVEIEQSTSWRLIQAALAPYRRLRGLR